MCSPDVFRVINTVSSKSQMLPWVCGTRDIVTAENTGRRHVEIVSGQFINFHDVLNYTAARMNIQVKIRSENDTTGEPDWRIYSKIFCLKARKVAFASRISSKKNDTYFLTCLQLRSIGERSYQLCCSRYKVITVRHFLLKHKLVCPENLRIKDYFWLLQSIDTGESFHKC